MFETLNESPLTLWLNSLLWGFPAAEVFHIVMTGGFFGGIAALDLRLLGVHRRVSVMTLMRHLIPLLWWLFIGVVLSGALLFLFMPLEYSQNPVFLTKLVMILLGGINALFMHIALLRDQHHWDSHIDPPSGVKFSAMVSLLIWMVTLACGRLIAYFYGVDF